MNTTDGKDTDVLICTAWPHGNPPSLVYDDDGCGVFSSLSKDFDGGVPLSRRNLELHVEAMFYGLVCCEQVCETCLQHGDVVIIDKAIDPHVGDIVVGYADGQFVLRVFDKTFSALVWGVVVWAYRRKSKMKYNL